MQWRTVDEREHMHGHLLVRVRSLLAPFQFNEFEIMSRVISLVDGFYEQVLHFFIRKQLIHDEM